MVKFREVRLTALTINKLIDSVRGCIMYDVVKVVCIHGNIVAKLLRGRRKRASKGGRGGWGNRQPRLEIVLWLPTQIFSAEEQQILSWDKQCYV